MKASYGEGLANHTSLEPCDNCSNVMAEALTEGSAGGLLGSGNHQLSGADHRARGWRQHVPQRKMRVTERPGGGSEPGMSGSWKSDNNIVPEKPANNEVKTFAEQVEGGALTEGNTMNTAAVRTQGRVAAPTGLYGVRRSAQFSKPEISALLPGVGAV